MNHPSPSCRESFRARAALLLGAVVLPWLLFGSPAAAADAGGVLRVLKLRHHGVNHPYRDVAGEFHLLGDFAHRQGLSIEWIDAVQPAQLEARLRAGAGDILIADLPPAATDMPPLPAGIALGTYRTVVFGRSDLEARDPRELDGLRVAISVASPLWPYLNALAAHYPKLVLVGLPDDTARETLLGGIGAGQYDAAVVGTRRHENPVAHMPRVKALFELSASAPARWRFADAALRDKFDAYLMRFHAAVLAPQEARGARDPIASRRVLRVITRIDPQNYFIRDGRQAGFEYELVRAFARKQGLDVEFLVTDSERQMTDWLRRGVGDMVTTRIDAGRVRADPGLEQARRYFHSASVIIHRKGGPPLTAAALDGLRVGVLSRSVQHRALGALVASGIASEPLVLGPEATAAALARRVVRGEIDAAIVDAWAVTAIRAAHPDIRAGASLPHPFHYAWTVRVADTHLKDRIDRFVRDQFRDARYNTLARRYFRQRDPSRFAPLDTISPYDELVRRHAEANGFDWRLIVAQMYQESGFDARAESGSGARGLMQLLPSTARALGVRDAFDPDSAIRGGVSYLRELRQRFDADIGPRERTWFALAAYNLGYAGVEQARRRAAREGLDPTRWFGHVELIMRQLAVERAHARWTQVVTYVQAIRTLYSTYSQLQQTLAIGNADASAAATAG